MAATLIAGGVGTSADASPARVSTRSSAAVVEAPVLTPAAVARGHKLQISGILPTAVRRPVTVQRKQGSHWTTLAVGRTAADGRYRLHLKAPRAVGRYKLRVHAKRRKSLPALNSKVARLDVSRYAPGSKHAERAALLDIYKHTKSHDHYWAYYRGWGSSADVCRWSGVTCTSGHVTGLYLIGAYDEGGEGGGWLSGAIPASIGNMTHLRTLVLEENRLTGRIPSTFKALTDLRTLELSGAVSGPIPSWIGTLTKLRALDLTYGNLTGSIPDSIADLVNLRAVALGGGLTGSVPAWFGDLTHLRDLSLDGNNLTGSIPDSIGRLVDLEDLDLGNNDLTGSIPASLGGLAKLSTLALEGNRLSGEIPAAFVKLASMQYLLFLNPNDCLTATEPALVDWLMKRNYTEVNGCVTNGG